MLAKLQALVDRFSSLNVLIVGDFFLDKYLIIDPALDEPSLETGLTAYQVVAKRLYPGAAGTVTNNVTALGAHVIALGVIGEDGEGYDLVRELKARGVDTTHLIMDAGRVTPTYTKPMVKEAGGERELNRQDIKNQTDTPGYLEDSVIEKLKRLVPQADAVIALDQVVEEGRGVLTPKVRAALMELGAAGACPVMYADSRGFITQFRELTVKCNHLEAAAAVGVSADDEASAKAAALKLSSRNHRPVFITRGDKGMWVAEGGEVLEAPGIRVDGPLDICGAGDAATSGIVLALAAGGTPLMAAHMGNAVASITIQQLGVTGTATPDQLKDRLSKVHQ